MVDAIVTLRLRPEICGWNRNYFYVEQLKECMKGCCSVKPLLESPELVFICMEMVCYLALRFFTRKNLNFVSSMMLKKNILICKGMKDFYSSSSLKYTYSHLKNNIQK